MAFCHNKPASIEWHLYFWAYLSFSTMIVWMIPLNLKMAHNLLQFPFYKLNEILNLLLMEHNGLDTCQNTFKSGRIYLFKQATASNNHIIRKNRLHDISTFDRLKWGTVVIFYKIVGAPFLSNILTQDVRIFETPVQMARHQISPQFFRSTLWLSPFFIILYKVPMDK